MKSAQTKSQHTSNKDRRVAVFDIDGTLFRSSLLIELVNALIHAGIFPRSIKKTYSPAYRKWLDRKGDYDVYIRSVVQVFDDHIAGTPYKEVHKVAKRVTTIHKNHTYRYTRDLLQDLKSRGYFLLAVSHSPRSIVEEFARAAGFDKVYARIFETNQGGKFTGNILHADLIDNKDKVLERAVHKEHLTLEDSYGVGDTESDIPFLQMVTNPICFNPNKKLFEHAKSEKWSIVVERKDVIYKI